MRAARVEAGAAASVLNFVINPSTSYDLPFFGADLVTLPAGHLLALDLQPALKTDTQHTKGVWEGCRFSSAGNNASGWWPSPRKRILLLAWLPVDSHPLGSEGDALIEEAVKPARDYLELYLQLVHEAER